MPKRSEQLFRFLVDIAENLQETASYFESGLRDLRQLDEFMARLKDYEHRGDELTSGLVTLLNATYITPLEREDFLELAVSMDDIVDGLEACAVRFGVYQITEATPVMHEFAQNILQSVQEIRGAMDRLFQRRLKDLREYTMKINQLEKAGDAVLRNALRDLFGKGRYDVLDVIKFKEIYETLESVTDRCQDVADVLDSITVKNA